MAKILFKLVAIITITIGMMVLSRNLLELNNLLYSSLADKVTYIQLKEILDFQKKWEWVSYVFVALIIIVKTSIISSVLYIAIFFSKAEITFKSIYNKVIQAEFIFLLVPVFKILWFGLFQTSYKLEDIQNFFPLSAINITGYAGLEPWYIYPLQTFNLFEVAYVFYLGYQIANLTESTPDQGLRMVVSSYVPALLLWVCCIMFLTLNYS
jgi:hypothetical protein